METATLVRLVPTQQRKEHLLALHVVAQESQQSPLEPIHSPCVVNSITVFVSFVGRWCQVPFLPFDLQKCLFFSLWSGILSVRIVYSVWSRILQGNSGEFIFLHSLWDGTHNREQRFQNKDSLWWALVEWFGRGNEIAFSSPACTKTVLWCVKQWNLKHCKTTFWVFLCVSSTAIVLQCVRLDMLEAPDSVPCVRSASTRQQFRSRAAFRVGRAKLQWMRDRLLPATAVLDLLPKTSFCNNHWCINSRSSSSEYPKLCVWLFLIRVLFMNQFLLCAVSVCMAGYQVSGNGCRACEIGKYSTTTAATSCTSCPTDSTTSAQGASSASECSKICST